MNEYLEAIGEGRTCAEIAKVVGVPRQTAHKALTRMVKRGFVKKSGNRYEVRALPVPEGGPPLHWRGITCESCSVEVAPKAPTIKLALYSRLIETLGAYRLCWIAYGRAPTLTEIRKLVSRPGKRVGIVEQFRRRGWPRISKSTAARYVKELRSRRLISPTGKPKTKVMKAGTCVLCGAKVDEK